MFRQIISLVVLVTLVLIHISAVASYTPFNKGTQQRLFNAEHYRLMPTDSLVGVGGIDDDANLFLDSEMQFGLGVMYDTGVGVAQNDGFALLWYQMAADQGHARAQYNLALMYDSGQGVPQNDYLALTWYKKSAQQGHAEAQYNLAVMYDRGQGIEQNDNEALLWYKKAAAQNDADAKRIIPIVETKIRARNLYPNAPKLFGRSLVGAQRNTMRTLLKEAGIIALREENGFFADKYDPSQTTLRADELYTFYSQDFDRNGWLGTDFLAKVIFLFTSNTHSEQLNKVFDYLQVQYGEPDIRNIEEDVSAPGVVFGWHQDGVEIALTRKNNGLPIYLTYSVTMVEQVMNDEITTVEEAQAAAVK